MQKDMVRSLGRRAAASMLRFVIVLVLLIFLSAGTLGFWQGWLFCCTFTLCMIVTTLFFLKYDPALVERRMSVGPVAEREPRQKRIQLVASVIVLAIFLVPALDFRFDWSFVPAWIVIGGDALIVHGFLMIFRVFRENSFASAIVEVGTDQKVISTGPYALLRHPMYAGALVLFIGVPLALGSWWGLLMIPPMLGILIARLHAEESYLVQNLAGYEDYRRRTRYRLFPGIW